MRRLTCTAALVGLTALACEVPEVDEGRFPAIERSDGAVAEDAGLGPSLSADAGRSLGDATGTWYLFTEDRKCLSAVGTAVENLVWTRYRVKVVESPETASGGRTWRADLELCAQDLSPFMGGLRTIVPETIPAALPVREWNAWLTGTEAGATFVGTEIVELWGGQNLGPDESLPTEIDDERIFDLDRDGKPGATFGVGSGSSVACEVYLVQRTRLRLEGELVNSRRIEGGFWSQLDKSILDATSPLCSPENEMVESPVENRFVLVRVDGQGGGLNLDLNHDGEVSCAELLEAEPLLRAEGGAAPSEPDSSQCR